MCLAQIIPVSEITGSIGLIDITWRRKSVGLVGEWMTVLLHIVFLQKKTPKTSSFCPLTESGSWMRMEISGREQKQGKKRVEVQEVMQKGQPLWCTSEISFSFISSKSAGGNYSPLIIVKLSFFFFLIFTLHVLPAKIAAVTLIKSNQWFRKTQHFMQVIKYLFKWLIIN